MLNKIFKRYLGFFKINYYLRNNKVRRLHIGCGYNILGGWLNTDINIEHADIFQDAGKRFPFNESTFDYVFCENFIEHIPYEKGRFFIQECYRVLKKDGILRVATPDLKLLIRMYENKNPHVKREEVIKRHEKITKKTGLSPCELFNDKMRRWGHMFIYDQDLLIKALRDNGFKSLVKCEYGKSKHKELQDVEHHADVDWMKNAEPMIFECRKKDDS